MLAALDVTSLTTGTVYSYIALRPSSLTSPGLVPLTNWFGTLIGASSTLPFSLLL